MLKTDSPIFLQNMNMIARQLFLLFKKSTTFWDNPRIYKGRYGAIHQTKIPFVALDPVRDTIMIGIFI